MEFFPCEIVGLQSEAYAALCFRFETGGQFDSVEVFEELRPG